MKRILCLILTCILCLSLCACESPQEKANREIREANAAYRDSQQKLDDLESQLEEVQRKIAAAEGN